MFDELRKKISNAVKGLIKKEEAVEKEEVEEKKGEIERGDAAQPVMAEEQHEDGKKEHRAVERHGAAAGKDIGIRVSAATKLKGVFLHTVQLNDSEIDGFLDNLKVSLLQSDVSYKTTEEFLDVLRGKLGSAKMNPKRIQEEVLASVRESLLDVLRKAGTGVNLQEFISGRVKENALPVKILFLGPNGTGKTTTMGKLAAALKKAGITCVFSASDTFRAAAIEQTEHHANKIGVPVIKSKYGADPASVAFDAIAYAKAHGIHVVLIDTAGRQETNKNLINEMQKMVRVAKPDLIIFVGESTAGNALTGQIEEFSRYMKIDGVILTKLDCDAKGGNAISIADATGVPILFFGVGESYEALVPYTPEFVVNSVLPNN